MPSLKGGFRARRPPPSANAYAPARGRASCAETMSRALWSIALQKFNSVALHSNEIELLLEKNLNSSVVQR